MKKILFLINLIVFPNFCTNAQSGWSKLISETNNELESVYFINTDIGYAAGGKAILKTTNGGTSWTTLNNPDSSLSFFSGYKSIYFINADTGYVGFTQWNMSDMYYSGSEIQKTTDGGITWVDEKFFGGFSYFISDMYFNGDTGFLLIDDIFKTVNGGKTWTILADTNIRPPASGVSGLSTFYFVNTNTGYAVGQNGKIIKTINGGASWVQLKALNIEYLTSVYFTDANTGYIAGYSNPIGVGVANVGLGIIAKTTNGGTTWSLDTIGNNLSLNSFCFADANTGYIVGAKYNGTSTGGIIIKTVDGGTTWSTDTSVTNILNSACCIENTCYAVGWIGTILKTHTETERTIISNILPEKLTIYPNPGNGEFTIELNNAENKLLQISIIDITGRIVFETTTKQNIYKLKSKELRSGVYQIAVRGDKIYYGKLIVK
jgi:photosystem II stability/assembly factor-like uncharacterized protein